TGGDVALGEHDVMAIEIGDEAAGLAHQNYACRHIPRREVPLPISIEASRRDPGEIERRGAETAQPGEVLLRGGDFAPGEGEVAAAVMRQSTGDDGIRKPLPP